MRAISQGKLTRRELLRRLRRLRKSLNATCEFINWGGCGVVAAAVGAALERRDIPCDVATPCRLVGDVWQTGSAANEVRGLVTDPTDPFDWSINGLSRSHLAVRFRIDGRTYLWDSDGLYSTTRYGKRDDGTLVHVAAGQLGDGLTVKECAAISAKARGWNSTFKRAQIPLIRHLVTHHLEYGL